jgi:hypothetical protein
MRGPFAGLSRRTDANRLDYDKFFAMPKGENKMREQMRIRIGGENG